MNVKKKLKDLQYKLIRDVRVKKEDQVDLISATRVYVKELEQRLAVHEDSKKTA